MAAPNIWHALSGSTKDHYAFRLLRIWPGTGDQPLVLGLSEERLEYNRRDKILQSNLPYEAISYCWGEASDQASVECNGKNALIGRNLHQALWTFRLLDRPRVVWVDALCINQNDQTEKDRQLKLMGYIYLRAQRVLVYLGSNANREADAFPLCRHLHTAAWNLGMANAAQYSFADGLIQAAAGYARPMRAGEAPQIRALRALFALPYFTRVWTLQEVYLNSNVLFHCGPFTLEYVPLFCGLHYAATNALIFTQEDPLWPHIMSFVELLSRKDTHDKHTSSELLDIVRPQKCLEPRDKVYALTMMLRHLSPDNTLIPQEEDANTVFIKAAAHLIGAEGGLNFISKADLSRNLSRKLPSWVPDWDHSAGAHQWFDTVWRREISFRPTKESVFWFDWRNDKELALRGTVLSRVCAITDALPDQRDFLVGETLSADSSDGSIRTSVQLFRKYLEYLVKFEPLLHFADDTQESARQPSETWKAFTAFDIAYAQSKGWKESHREWKQFYETFAQDIRKWTPFVKKGRHKGMRLYAEGVRMQLDQQRWKQANNEFRNRLWVHGRRLARDEEGRLINAPVHAQVGDWVALLVGGRAPYILRQHGPFYLLVGDCYIDGIMDGEAWDESQRTEIVLV